MNLAFSLWKKTNAPQTCGNSMWMEKSEWWPPSSSINNYVRQKSGLGKHFKITLRPKYTCSKSHDLTSIAICDSNRKSQSLAIRDSVNHLRNSHCYERLYRKMCCDLDRQRLKSQITRFEPQSALRKFLRFGLCILMAQVYDYMTSKIMSTYVWGI